MNYTYDNDHPHGVWQLSNGNRYYYDANGNQTQRVVGGTTYNLSYDAENRLIGVSGTNLSAAFTYDADGKRVQQVLNNVTTKFIGPHYEVEGTTVRKYYLAGTTRMAMRTGTDAPVYFLQDHLGSTSITTNSSGNFVAEIMYKPWGEVRFVDGTTPTNYTYTGQYSNIRDDSTDIGLMYYGSRWYDPALSRFAQADSIIPGAGNPQAYDRYAYVFNNPINGTDPTGHITCSSENDNLGSDYCITYQKLLNIGWQLIGTDWILEELKTIYQTALDIATAIGGIDLIYQLFGEVIFEKIDMKNPKDGATGSAHHVYLSKNRTDWNKWSIVHELGHGLDELWDYLPSYSLEDVTKGKTNWVMGVIYRIGLSSCEEVQPGCNTAGYYYGDIPPKGSNDRFNRREDFAESFAAFVYPDVAFASKKAKYESRPYVYQQLYYSNYLTTMRGFWMSSLIYMLLH